MIAGPGEGQRLQAREEGYRRPQERERLKWRLSLVGLLDVALMVAACILD